MRTPSETTVTGAAGRRVHAALRRRVRRVRSRAALWLLGDRLSTQMAAARVPIEAEVIVHFAEDPERTYQLTQWIPVLERLAEQHRVLIVLRDIRSMNALVETTSLPMVCVTSFLDLMSLYDLGEFKVCIYVNHGNRNFQSLNNPRMLHVHVNHGESDKLSSFSNQVKGYDRVFVAGPVAVERYREALLDFDDRKLVLVGRPQLDLAFKPAIPASERRTVMYAPTWEGESESNNWTSLDRYGVSIVSQALALPDVRLVYKPHPRVPSSRRPAIAEAHRKIVRLIEAAQQKDAHAGHLVNLDGNILAMFNRVDALVGDVSSVTLDYLYLRPEGPLLLTDRRNDPALLLEDAPVAEGADVVDSGSIAGFGSLLASRLVDDARQEDRLRVRKRYFGDLAPGESTERFLAAVDELITTRDTLLAGHRRVTTGDVDEHG